jgi:hypothetical protein
MEQPKVKIVLLPVEEYDRRKVAEAYENAVFETIEDARKVFGENAGISQLTTFMDMCNDEELNLEGYWITYITIKN